MAPPARPGGTPRSPGGPIVAGLLALACCRALPSTGETPLPPAEPIPLSASDVEKILVGLNQIERFPAPLSHIEARAGVSIRDHLQPGPYMHARIGDLALTLSGTGHHQPEGEPPRADDPWIDAVEIKRRGTELPLPPRPLGAIRFDVGTYACLPTVEHVEPVGDGYYRHLRHAGRVQGPEAPIQEWIYTVDRKRGPYLSEDERQGLQREILGLLQAIREDRFVARYESFRQAFPEDDLGSHALYGHTITIRQFDARNERYRSDFLEEDGLTAYVGIHVYNEAHSEARSPHPYLFDFFGLEQLDAMSCYRGKPYNPLHRGMAGSAHPLADLQNPLPDIRAAGHRDGGLAYYAHLEHREGGWTFEGPGFYPHDGKEVATQLDPSLLQFGGFVVTHSRPR